MAGQTGPLSYKPGYDYMGQAYAGITNLIGEPDRPPSITTMAIGDISTGVSSAMAVGFSLLNRERTGEGQFIDASLIDTYFHMHELNVPLVSMRAGQYEPNRAGSLAPNGAPTGMYKASDGAYIFLTVLPHQWPQLLRAMDNAGSGRGSPFQGRSRADAQQGSAARRYRRLARHLPRPRRGARRARQASAWPALRC